MFLLLWAATAFAAMPAELQRACQLNSPTACVELAFQAEKAENYVKAHTHHRQACGLGEAQSCFVSGFYFQTGKGGVNSLDKARKSYSSGCSLGHGASCVNLGAFYVQGSGVDIDLSAAAAYFSQGCEIGDRRGCTHYGMQLLRGSGVEKNLGTAVKLLDVACQVGASDACAALLSDAGPELKTVCESGGHRHCYDASRFAADPKDAESLSGLGCKNGFELACVKLGFYEIESTPLKAVQRFRSACKSGVGEGCFSLAIAYLEGRGTPKSEPKTLEYLDKSCEFGDLRGCEQAAIFYRRIGDIKSASSRLQTGCNGGRMASCSQLGFLKAKEGKEAAGAGLFSKACIGGHAQSCFNLAVMINKGQGVTADPVRASRLMTEACRLGSNQACDIVRKAR